MELSEFMRKHRAQSDKFEYDFDYVNIPLEWFESDEILKSHLAEI